MTRCPLLITHCSLLIVLLSCASSQIAGPVDISGDVAGLAHGGRTNSPEEYALMDRMGARWILRTFNWRRIQPAEDLWDFDFHDEYVNTANAAGIKVLGTLGYDVPWIHEGGNGPRYIPPDKTHYFLEYVRRTAEHFRGRVDAWGIWNEPNSHRFWQGSKEEFFELSRLAAEAVREVDPDVTVLGGGFNRGVFGLPRAFIRGLFEAGAMEQADAVAFHPYEMNPARTARLYRRFRDLVAPYGFEDRIWIREVGYPTGGRYPTSIPERKLPEYVVKTFVQLAVEGPRKILWYQLFDPLERDRRVSGNFFGLVRSRSDYTSKGAEAFRLCAVYLAGATYRPDLPLRDVPSSLEVFYFERPQGGGALVLWKRGRPARIRLHGPGVYTVHDPVSGDAAVISEIPIEVGTVPVFITWQEDGAPPLRLSRERR